MNAFFPMHYDDYAAKYLRIRVTGNERFKDASCCTELHSWFSCHRAVELEESLRRTITIS